MSYIIVDTQNLFYRARHVVRAGDIDLKVGMAVHILFSSIVKSYRDFEGKHVVFCLEGRSWRKDFYEPYKQNRKATRDAMSIEEKQEDEIFNNAFNQVIEYIKTETKCTVLRHPICEADDFIARWIQLHPNDKHVIVSTDSDFYQLINENVSQYNGVTNQHITINGVFNDSGKPVMDNKTKKQKTIGNPEYVLFEKCIRGDTSDNIFPAYPGVRKNGTKNKVGIIQAFEDKNKKGFEWNNFMLQRWTDHNNKEHIVVDDYNRNKTLIDLTQQPQYVKDEMDKIILEAVSRETPSQIGIRFMKFCGKFNLVKMSERPNDFTTFLNSSYQK
jgi:5'-3' exonuclease